MITYLQQMKQVQKKGGSRVRKWSIWVDIIMSIVALILSIIAVTKR